jgi:hypothetical protein
MATVTVSEQSQDEEAWGKEEKPDNSGQEQAVSERTDPASLKDDGDISDRLTVVQAVQACWSHLDKQHATRTIKAGDVELLVEGSFRVFNNPGKRNVIPGDRLRLNGEVRSLPPPLVVMLHKPINCTTTNSTTEDETTVYTVLNHPNKNLRAIGRLDKATEGVLLFTNQGVAFPPYRPSYPPLLLFPPFSPPVPPR